MPPYNHKTPIKQKRRKVILLSDETGKGMNILLRNKLNDSDVQSVIKPNAPLSVVMDDIHKIAVPLSKRDAIIILAGKNDFGQKAFPSFKLICNKLKKCDTNIIFSSVPYTYNFNTNKRNFKFNCKLNDFLIKLNKVTEGTVQYFEINHKNNKINKSVVAERLARTVNNKSVVYNKTLIFVPITNQLDFPVCVGSEPTENNNDSDIELEESRTSSSESINIISNIAINSTSQFSASNTNFEHNFLYPRLSQMSLL